MVAYDSQNLEELDDIPFNETKMTTFWVVRSQKDFGTSLIDMTDLDRYIDF